MLVHRQHPRSGGDAGPTAPSGRSRLALAGLLCATLLALLSAVPAMAGASGLRWRIGGSPITESTTVEFLSGNVVLTESGAYEQDIACKLTGTGTIAPEGGGTIGSVTLTSCVGSRGCERLESASAKDLPWALELYETAEGQQRVRVKEDGKGTPQWETSCEVSHMAKNINRYTGNLSDLTTNTSEGVDLEADVPSAVETILGFGHVEAGMRVASREGIVSVATAPVATTSPARAVGTAVQLHGTVRPSESETTYQFEYGTTTSYGSSIPTSAAPVAHQSTPVPVEQEVKGLTAGTAYHYRLTAKDPYGTSHGEDRTFVVPLVEWRVAGAGLTEAASVALKGKLKLADSGLGTSVECEDSGSGAVAVGQGGEVGTLSVSKCVNLKGCESATTVTALNLPWHTELSLGEGLTHDALSNGGSGEPAYRLKCKALGVEVTDECKAVSPLSTTVSNGPSAVTLTLPAGKGLTCNGSANVGSFEGSQTVEAAVGKLSATTGAEASKLAEAEWHVGLVGLTAIDAITWKGKIALSDSSLGYAIECSESSEGLAWPGSGGELTKVAASSCISVKGCESPIAVEMTGLPWHTELVQSEGSIHEVLQGSGVGAPGFKMKCNVFGVKVEDECKAGAPIGVGTSNGTTGVTIGLPAGKTLTCKKEGVVGAIEGSQTAELVGGGGSKLETAT